MDFDNKRKQMLALLDVDPDSLTIDRAIQNTLGIVTKEQIPHGLNFVGVTGYEIQLVNNYLEHIKSQGAIFNNVAAQVYCPTNTQAGSKENNADSLVTIDSAPEQSGGLSNQQCVLLAARSVGKTESIMAYMEKTKERLSHFSNSFYHIDLNHIEMIPTTFDFLKKKQTRGEKKRKFVEQQNKSKGNPPKHLTKFLTLLK